MPDPHAPHSFADETAGSYTGGDPNYLFVRMGATVALERKHHDRALSFARTHLPETRAMSDASALAYLCFTSFALFLQHLAQYERADEGA